MPDRRYTDAVEVLVDDDAADVVLVTPRLRLRRWRAEDREPFAVMNADAAVMEHFPRHLSREESDALAGYCDSCFDRLGFGLAAVERRGDGAFLGFVGLHRQRWYPDDVEIGWRLARDAWGRGYATEAALAWRDRAFGVLGLDRLISITTPENTPSIAVMRRLGMQEDHRATHEGIDVVVHALARDGVASPRRPGPGAG